MIEALLKEIDEIGFHVATLHENPYSPSGTPWRASLSRRVKSADPLTGNTTIKQGASMAEALQAAIKEAKALTAEPEADPFAGMLD